MHFKKNCSTHWSGDQFHGRMGTSPVYLTHDTWVQNSKTVCKGCTETTKLNNFKTCLWPQKKSFFAHLQSFFKVVIFVKSASKCSIIKKWNSASKKWSPIKKWILLPKKWLNSDLFRPKKCLFTSKMADFRTVQYFATPF